MSLTLSLSEIEEAKLRARAREKGTTVEELIRSAIAPMLSNSSDATRFSTKPSESLLGLWAEFGPGPSAEEIDENRADMLASFGREDIA
jgi:hypothetical protein